MPHDRDFKSKQHGAVAQRNPKVCAACHKSPKECTTCHEQLKKSPHPDNLAMEHKAQARFEKGASCFLCHKIDYCQQCHPDAQLK
jgi:hypothetical protein